MMCTLVVIGAGYAHAVAVGKWLFICLYVRAWLKLSAEPGLSGMCCHVQQILP